MEDLKQLREKIDGIDKEIVKLLHTRFDIVKQVKQLKASHHVPVLDSKREEIILKRFEQEPYKREITAVYKAILTVSKDLQKVK